MDRKEINAKFKELAELTRISEELADEIESIKDELKAVMTEQNVDTLIGDEHKATWKEVTSHRFDSKAFKAAGHADLYNAFTKPSTSKKFTFA